MMNRNVMLPNVALCLLAAFVFALPPCLRWKQSMDNIRSETTVLINYTSVPEILIAIATIMASVFVNRRLQKVEKRKVARTATIVILPVLTILLSFLLSLFITHIFIEAYRPEFL